jgi:hypothetical protein
MVVVGGVKDNQDPYRETVWYERGHSCKSARATESRQEGSHREETRLGLELTDVKGMQITRRGHSPAKLAEK